VPSDVETKNKESNRLNVLKPGDLYEKIRIKIQI
jgi:hypothetical protein